MEAINEYNNETTLQWIPRTDQTDYVAFWYTAGVVDGATVGDFGGMDIASIDTNWPSSVANTLHEMGHTLGLEHEQQRTDAGSYIVVNTQNIAPGWADAWTRLPPSEIKDVGPYDYNSIMEYNSYAFSANGQPVATEVKGSLLPANTKLSAEDISTLDSLYPAPAGQAQVPQQVAATAIAPDQIKITWSDTNAGQATYSVERAVAGQAYQEVATLPAGSTSYVNSQATPGVLYQYMVVATTAANVPAVSQIVYAAASAQAPILTAAVEPSGAISLKWDNPYADQAPDYSIEYSTAQYFQSSDGWFSSGSSQGTLDPDVGSSSYTTPFDVSAQDLPNVRYTFQLIAQSGQAPALWTAPSSNIATVGTLTGTPTGPTSSSPIATSPQVLGVVDVQHAKKKVTSISIAFNEAMNSGSVGNAALYHLFGGVHKRSKIVYSKKIKLGTVSYNAAAHTLSISLAKPDKGPIRVSVDGMIEALDGLASNSLFSQVVR